MTPITLALASTLVTLTAILACAILQRAEIEARDDAADREGVDFAFHGSEKY